MIENVAPNVDDGRYAPKRIVGERCVVGADIFREGYALLAARVRFRGPHDADWHSAPLAYDYDADRWFGGFELEALGRWEFTVEAWTDRFGTWRDQLRAKVTAGDNVALDLREGAALVRQTISDVALVEARQALGAWAVLLDDNSASAQVRASAALDQTLAALMRLHEIPDDLTTLPRPLPVVVERERAEFAAWYEMFPRSQSSRPGHQGTFADAERALPRLAELGFDVVYLPPIHPIGRTARKGRNNALTAMPGDVGSPWAIGNELGGHTAVDPALGTLADFDRFVRYANELGLDVALDYALQCSPDHPWVREHPNWFHIRADGSIQYAENPPMKYHDIVPLDFWTEDREALWNACLDVMRFWISHGVRTFRVDNPHTKPFIFWEWMIGEVRREHPEVVLLAESFTRPKKLLELSKTGFSQSYTYFTWKNTRAELTEFMTEFSTPQALEYFRGNLFTNTPDVLHAYLQRGGRPAFRVRLLLAATLSPAYGIYSGFELCERVPVRPGSEEYLNSEIYELRPRRFDAPGNLDADIALLNQIRREHAALQHRDNLTFLPADNEQILFYRKAAPTAGDADFFVAVNLDPARPQHGVVHVPIDALELAADEPYLMEDLLSGARYTWRGARNFVLLDPSHGPGHLLRFSRIEPETPTTELTPTEEPTA